MKRSQGEVSDNSVKYADVLSPGATVKQKLPPWARDLTNKLPPRPAFETPNRETLTQSGIALGVLMALVLAQGCTQVRPLVFFPCYSQLTCAFLIFYFFPLSVLHRCTLIPIGVIAFAFAPLPVSLFTDNLPLTFSDHLSNQLCHSPRELMTPRDFSCRSPCLVLCCCCARRTSRLVAPSRSRFSASPSVL